MRQQGFSLIKILADGVILTTLILLVIVLGDPVGIYMKAQDQSKKNHLLSIHKALDSYFYDNHCYPSTIPFGKKWAVGNKVYMDNVPQDKLCSSNPAQCYLYQVNTRDACPKWNVLYTKVSHGDNKGSCQLKEATSACLPLNYEESWACDVSGNVECDYIANSSLLSPLQNRTDFFLATKKMRFFE